MSVRRWERRKFRDREKLLRGAARMHEVLEIRREERNREKTEKGENRIPE